MADVFISYPIDSAAEVVKRIADALKMAGISCWYANRDIYEGNYVGQITRAIRECKVFLLILNQEAMQSQYMESEAALAFRRVMNHEKLTFLCVNIGAFDFTNETLNFYTRPFLTFYAESSAEKHISKLIPELTKRVSRLAGYANPITARHTPEQGAPRPAENL